MQVNYPVRICNDTEKIQSFLSAARIGVLGLNAGEYPYTVPVNFVYLDSSFYFHGMGSGKKFGLLSQNPSVSFVVYAEDGTVKDTVACHADTAYFSVMAFGKAGLIKDFKESARVLQALVEKYMPAFYKSKLTPELMKNYTSDRDKMPTAVYRITVEHLTAKQNIAEKEDLF